MQKRKNNVPRPNFTSFYNKITAWICSAVARGGAAPPPPHPPWCKTITSFARSPKSEFFERVLAHSREMRERGEERVAQPGEKGNGDRGGFRRPRDSLLAPFFHFTTARQNSLKNSTFRTSGERRGCFVVYPLPSPVIIEKVLIDELSIHVS